MSESELIRIGRVDYDERAMEPELRLLRLIIRMHGGEVRRDVLVREAEECERLFGDIEQAIAAIEAGYALSIQPAPPVR